MEGSADAIRPIRQGESKGQEKAGEESKIWEECRVLQKILQDASDRNYAEKEREDGNT